MTKLTQWRHASTPSTHASTAKTPCFQGENASSGSMEAFLYKFPRACARIGVLGNSVPRFHFYPANAQKTLENKVFHRVEACAARLHRSGSTGNQGMTYGN